MGCSCWAARCAIRTVNVEHGPSKRLDHLFRPVVVFPAEAGRSKSPGLFPGASATPGVEAVLRSSGWRTPATRTAACPGAAAKPLREVESHLLGQRERDRSLSVEALHEVPENGPVASLRDNRK